jgi:hypothetical protein
MIDRLQRASCHSDTIGPLSRSTPSLAATAAASMRVSSPTPTIGPAEIDDTSR